MKRLFHLKELAQLIFESIKIFERMLFPIKYEGEAFLGICSKMVEINTKAVCLESCPNCQFRRHRLADDRRPAKLRRYWSRISRPAIQNCGFAVLGSDIESFTAVKTFAIGDIDVAIVH